MEKEKRDLLEDICEHCHRDHLQVEDRKQLSTRSDCESVNNMRKDYTKRSSDETSAKSALTDSEDCERCTRQQSELSKSCPLHDDNLSSSQNLSSSGCCCVLPAKATMVTNKDTPEKLYGHIILISVSFFFMFCSYNGLESLQSSLNVNVGQAAVGIIYAILIVCSLTVAPICVGRWQPKVCICVSWLCYLSFTLANMYPVWWTMFSSAVLLGFGASLVWIAQGVYITDLSQKYSQLTGQSYHAVLSKFNGIFFSIFASTMIFGNLISSLLFLHSKRARQTNINSSLSFLDESMLGLNSTHALGGGQVCGSGNCPYLQAHRVYSAPPDASLVQMLFYIFLTCNVIGLVTACFLENVETREPTNGASHAKNRIKEVFLLVKDPKLLLLIIPLISIRLFQSMSISAYNQAFVTCSLGIGMVGYVMISRATCYMIASYISGKTGQSSHQWAHFAVAMVFYIAVALTWLFWTPNKSQMWMFFIIPSLEGIGSGIWRVQVGVILGWLFPNKKEAAFAHHNAWLGLGSCIVFSAGSFFCFYTKTYFILAVIGLSIVSYSGLELKLHRESTNKVADDQC